MRVLVGCEESGRVRDAFRALGHNAWSCDLLPTSRPGPHIQGDVREALRLGWDLFIAHPPCTYTCVSGNRHYAGTERRAEGVAFVREMLEADVELVAVEQPISVCSTLIRKPDQVVQPWQFGHGETKATCLWLRGLRKLLPTQIVAGREARVHRMPPSRDRSRLRSETYPGIAAAMAAQWGNQQEGRNGSAINAASR